jgi:hypothetical protein
MIYVGCGESMSSARGQSRSHGPRSCLATRPVGHQPTRFQARLCCRKNRMLERQPWHDGSAGIVSYPF